MNRLRTTTLLLLMSGSLIVLNTSCATVFGGRVTSCQRTAPVSGQPQRQIRVAALVLDILLFWPGAGIDFLTGAIYRPCDRVAVSQAPAPAPARYVEAPAPARVAAKKRP